MTTPNRPPLSPAAQAVLDAANGCCSYGPDDVLNECRWIVAAALRAAANQIKPSQQNHDEASHEFAKACLNGMAYAANELRIIATELEAQS